MSPDAAADAAVPHEAAEHAVTDGAPGLPDLVRTERLWLPLVTPEDAAGMLAGRRRVSWHADYPRREDQDAATLVRADDPDAGWRLRHVVRSGDGTTIGSIGFYGPPEPGAPRATRPTPRSPASPTADDVPGAGEDESGVSGGPGAGEVGPRDPGPGAGTGAGPGEATGAGEDRVELPDDREPSGARSVAAGPPRPLEVEVGFGLVPDARGHGAAREALVALLAHTDRLGLRVRARLRPENVAALRVLAGCGFTELRGRDEDDQLVVARPPTPPAAPSAP